MNTRTKALVSNINYSLILMVVDAIASFVIRTVFIKYMLVEELGLNGFFSDLSVVLSIAESGVGAAYSSLLYKAFHEKNFSKVQAIFVELKKTYHIIAYISLALGVVLFPFVSKYIIKDQYGSITLLYILFILKLFFTYAYSSYYTLIYADQRLYEYKKLCLFSLVIRIIIQIVAILVFSDYKLYFAASVIYAVLPYIMLKNKAEHIYPHIKSNEEELDDSDKALLKERMWGGMVVHIAYIIFNGTDYILITSFVGLKVAGLYSNYTIFIMIISSIISSIFVALTATVGDMIHDNDPQKLWCRYKTLIFANSYVVVGFAMCLVVLFQQIITIWLGSEYCLSQVEVVLIVIAFCLGENGLFKAPDSIRLSSGVYVRDKWYALGASVINILLSIALSHCWGLSGILMGTIASSFIYHIPAMYYVQKCVIQTDFKEVLCYYTKTIIKQLVIALIALICYEILVYAMNKNLLTILISGLVMVTVYIIAGIVFFRENEAKYILNSIKLSNRKYK